MPFLDKMREKLEDGGGAMFWFGLGIGTIAILVLTSWWVFSVTGLDLYSSTMHHDAAIAYFDWWFGRLQFALLFILFCVLSSVVLGIFAAVCYVASYVAGVVTVKWLRKKA